jgi:hypothetical protein
MGRPPIGKVAMTSTERSRRYRAGLSTKPAAATKPAEHATKQEAGPRPAPERDWGAELRQREAEITQLKARIAELETKPSPSDDRVAELEAALKKTQRGFIWSMKEYRDVVWCIHPDRVKFLNDDKLTARFDAAFRVVDESKNLLVDKKAENRDAEHHARERNRMEQSRKWREAWAAQEAARKAKAKERYERKKAEKAAAKAAQA